MDYLTEPNSRTAFDYAPVLIAGDSDDALHRAARVVEAAGLRVADRVGLDVALARIDRQARASAMWIELDEDGGGPMDLLLDRVNRDVEAGRYGAVVSARAALLDPLSARLSESRVEILVDAGEGERVAALALALAQAQGNDRLLDVAGDRNADRLRQLSDEVSRIAATLARLSTGPASAGKAIERPASEGDIPDVSADTIRAVIRARRLRSRYFREDLFADPAWDMLLDLLQAEIAQLRVPVSSLCIAAAVPATTALRWLKTMTQEGLFVRRADPHDGRRVFVELAPDASRALRRYFAEVGKVAVI